MCFPFNYKNAVIENDVLRHFPNFRPVILRHDKAIAQALHVRGYEIHTPRAIVCAVISAWIEKILSTDPSFPYSHFISTNGIRTLEICARRDGLCMYIANLVGPGAPGELHFSTKLYWDSAYAGRWWRKKLKTKPICPTCLICRLIML